MERSSEDVLEPPGGPRPVLSEVESEVPLASAPPPCGAPAHVYPIRLLKRAFVVGPQASAFRQRFFPGVSDAHWNDWRWQLRNRIQDPAQLSDFIRLSPAELAAIERRKGCLPLGITPYYASLVHPDDDLQPLRRTVVPVAQEDVLSPGESVDPLNERADSPVPGLVHRYPDRVLFLATENCSTFCRYCTRSRMVGHDDAYRPDPERWQRAIAYIQATPAVRDVLISGGDPLTMSDERLEWLLSRLRAIEHVEMIRIGTKVPAVLPQRITPELVRMLRRFHPVWMSLHFTHPDELTPETALACERLADAGLPLGSHTVLLKGINDDVQTLRRLMLGLVKLRVRPYYLFQCDPVPGSLHFRTPVSRGLELLDQLRGHISGYAVPNYVIDAPGGGGKIRLLPDAVLGRDGDDLLLRNYAGHVHRYPDPGGTVGLMPRQPSPASFGSDEVH